MPMMIGLSLTPQPPAGGDAPPPAPSAGTVALDAFSRDRTLFDGGAAFGRAEARVPLSGTGTAGRGVEARAVTEGGAPATGWAPIATVGPDGAWSGAIDAPRGPEWMRPEVRLAEAPWVAAQGAHRFGVGHVIAIWGQSEVEQMLQPNHDAAGRVTLADEDAVQIVWHDRDVIGSGMAGVRHLHLTNADPLTGAVSAMADALIAERPGEKFCVVFQAKSGTHFTDLLNDAADNKRAWADDEAAHRFATADGQHVGLAATSWFAAPRNLGQFYDEALFPAFFGRTRDGAAVRAPLQHSYGHRGSVRYDHFFTDLYDYDHTRWAPYGPHRFEPMGEMRDATHDAGGDGVDGLAKIEDCRRAWRRMVANPNHGGAMLPIAVESLNYLNGEDDNGPDAPGGWGDITHPAADTLDGLGQFGRLTAHACLRAAGLTSWPVPEFDRCEWDPAGAFVEVWSTAGPVTTTRRARGLPPLAADLPHWTEVVGFEIDGRPATRAEITAGGRVRVHPSEGAFTEATVLTYGSGGATGALNRQADLSARLWMNVPIVDVGAARVEGIAVRPLPDAGLLASTVGSGGGTGGGSGSGDGGSGSGDGGSGTGGGGAGGSGSGGGGDDAGTGGGDADGGAGSGGSSGARVSRRPSSRAMRATRTSWRRGRSGAASRGSPSRWWCGCASRRSRACRSSLRSPRPRSSSTWTCARARTSSA